MELDWICNLEVAMVVETLETGWQTPCRLMIHLTALQMSGYANANPTYVPCNTFLERPT